MVSHIAPTNPKDTPALLSLDPRLTSAKPFRPIVAISPRSVCELFSDD
jgi:hypothetical protein